MNLKINFKPFYLKKLLIAVILLGTFFSVFIFLAINIHITYKYFFLMIFVFVELLLVFYLNRYDIEELSFNNGIRFKYFNKTFFRMKSQHFDLKDIKAINKNDDKIKVLSKGATVAVIRKCSLDENDWETIKQILST